MHLRLRRLAKPPTPPLYPNINFGNDGSTNSLIGFSKHIKLKINLQDTPCTAILGNVMFAITRSFHIVI